MTAQQKREGTRKVILLVLLLYVLSLFVAGLLGYYGIDKAVTGITFQTALLATGLLMFLTRESRRNGQGSAVSVSDVTLAVSLAVALGAADVLAVAGRAAGDSDLRFAQLPPFPYLAAEQILAAFGEELLFTGFLFSSLRMRKSFAVSIATTAVLFVALHWPANLGSVTARAAYIIAACALFERTQSILVTIAMHLTVNGFGFIAVLLLGDAVPAFLLLGGMGAEAALAISVLVVLLALASVLSRSARTRFSAASSFPPTSETATRI